MPYWSGFFLYQNIFLIFFRRTWVRRSRWLRRPHAWHGRSPRGHDAPRSTIRAPELRASRRRVRGRTPRGHGPWRRYGRRRRRIHGQRLVIKQRLNWKTLVTYATPTFWGPIWANSPVTIMVYVESTFISMMVSWWASWMESFFPSDRYFSDCKLKLNNDWIIMIIYKFNE